MLANETTLTNSESIKARMKDGEEPTEVLLALVSSPLLTLRARGLARILTAKDEKNHPVVLAVFYGVAWSETVGMVLADGLPTLPTEKDREAVGTANTGGPA